MTYSFTIHRIENELTVAEYFEVSAKSFRQAFKALRDHVDSCEGFLDVNTFYRLTTSDSVVHYRYSKKLADLKGTHET